MHISKVDVRDFLGSGLLPRCPDGFGLMRLVGCNVGYLGTEYIYCRHQIFKAPDVMNGRRKRFVVLVVVLVPR